jgi:oxygen-independent coproporphyrinogen-3 oxidase
LYGGLFFDILREKSILREGIMSDILRPLTVDIVIPYCIWEERFTKKIQLMGSNAEKNAYMAALKRELLSWEGELDGYEVCALRLSGGNATVMSPDLLGDLLKTAREILPLAQGAEVSVDTQPLTVGTPSLTGIAAGRPNRMELMMRSGNDEELRALGCPHTMQNVKNAVLFFNRFHVNNFGLTVDLGIPGQTADSWRNTLHACTIIRPAHIRMQVPDIRDEEGLPGEEFRFKLYHQGCAFLKENGYLQYSAGDFCLPQHACRYRLAELDGVFCLGLGLGAVSRLDGYLTRNTNNLSIYLTYAGNYEKTTAEVLSVDSDYAMRDYASRRLQAVAGLSPRAFAERFGCDPPDNLQTELLKYMDQGLLEKNNKEYLSSERGLFSFM